MEEFSTTEDLDKGVQMKKWVMGVGAALLLGGSLGGSAAVAAPVPGAPDCADQLACIYINANFGGKFEHKGAGAQLTDVKFDNVASSWANKTYATGAWFMGFKGDSYCFSIAPRTTTPQLSGWQNDRLSSWQMTTGCQK